MKWIIGLLDWYASLWHGNFIALWDGQVDKNYQKQINYILVLVSFHINQIENVFRICHRVGFTTVAFLHY